MLASENEYDRFPWRKLTKPVIESWLYLACWTPKSQTEAIKGIYKDRKLTNIAPVIRARKFLMKAGYIEGVQSVDLREKKFFSNPEPFVEYAEIRVEGRRSLKGKQKLSDVERTVLIGLLDSRWFRKSFDQWLSYGVTAPGAMQTTAEFVEELCAISNYLGLVLPERLPQVREVVGQESFDDFLITWSKEKVDPYPRIKRILQFVGMRLLDDLPYDPTVKLLVTEFLSGPSVPALCIPWKLATKLSAIGRVPLTLTLAVDSALRRAREEGLW